MRWHCPPDTGFEIRPSTLPLGHGGSIPHNIESLRMSVVKNCVSLKLESQSGVRPHDLRLSKQAALTTAPGSQPRDKAGQNDLTLSVRGPTSDVRI